MKLEAGHSKRTYERLREDVRYDKVSTDNAIDHSDPPDVAPSHPPHRRYTTRLPQTHQGAPNEAAPPKYFRSERELGHAHHERLLRDSDTARGAESSWRVKKFIEGAELRMARHCCLRSFLTLFHLCVGFMAGFYTIYSLVGEGYNLSCVPPLVDYFGDPVTFRYGILDVCHSVFYSAGPLTVLSFLMALGINCFWENSCIIFTHFMLTVITAIISVFGGAVLTTHYLLWCDSLTQRMAPHHMKCGDAAEAYDKLYHSDNMTLYHTKLEVQQIGMWSIAPLALLGVITYGCTIYMSAVQDNEGSSLRGYVVLQEEQTPLLRQSSEGNSTREMQSPVITGHFTFVNTSSRDSLVYTSARTSSAPVTTATAGSSQVSMSASPSVSEGNSLNPFSSP